MASHQSLIDAFENNPYQTAAFAELDRIPTDKDWRELNSLLNAERTLLRSRDDKALVLWLLLSAGEEYDGNTFWPIVARKIGQQSLPQQYQTKLGDWFRAALNEFGYTVLQDGRTNLQPILLHVGIPRSNYPGLLRFLLTLLKRWGASIQFLESSQIATLIPDESQGSGLHVATIAFLKSQQREVADIWGPLLKLLRLRLTTSWREALDELPPFLHREVIEDELQKLDISQSPSNEISSEIVVPRFVFQSDFGRVVVEGSDLDKLVLNNGNSPIKLGPVEDSGEVTSRALHEPLPQKATMQWTDEPNTELEFYDDRFPSLWFRGGSGRYYGRTPEAGTSYVLLRGKHVLIPDEFQVEPYNLDWWALSQVPWQAFRVQLSPNQSFKVTIDGKEFTQPLGKTTSRHPKLENTHLHGHLVDGVGYGDGAVVVNEAPRILNPHTEPIEVEFQCFVGKLIAKETISSGQTAIFTTLSTGMYRVRFRPVSGRRAYWQPFANVAYVPSLQVDEPTYTEQYQSVTLTIHTSSDGQIQTDKSFLLNRKATLTTISGSTVNPSLRLGWRWNDTKHGPNFAWSVPLKGIRWRLSTTQGLGAWTREPFEFDRSKAFELEARLELQTPPDCVVRNGELTWKPNQQGLCSDYRQELKTLNGDVLTLHIGEQSSDVVYLTTRAHLSRFAVKTDGDYLQLYFDGHIPASNKLFEWNLLTPWERPIEHPRWEKIARIENKNPLDPRVFALAAPRVFALAAPHTGFGSKKYSIAWDESHKECEILWPKDATPAQRRFWDLLHKLIKQQQQGQKQLVWNASAEDAKGLDTATINSWVASIPASQSTLKQDATYWWRQFGPKPARNDLREFQSTLMETLGFGIHPFADGEPTLPDFPTPTKWEEDLFSRSYPLRFFEALRMLRGSFVVIQKLFPDSWCDELQEEAKFVFRILNNKDFDFLSLLEGLPLANQFSLANCRWWYCNDVLVNYDTDPDTARRCWELLGLREIELGVPACPDLFAKWRMEAIQNHREGWTCSRSHPEHQHSPQILVRRPRLVEFIERIGLCDLLEHFSTTYDGSSQDMMNYVVLLSNVPSNVRTFWEYYSDRVHLRHRELKLAGVSQMVQTRDWRVPSSVQNLWSLCWLERLYCTRLDKTGWAEYASTLPQQLQNAFLQDPQATCRMLILVEWLRVLLEHGDLGFAAHYVT